MPLELKVDRLTSSQMRTVIVHLVGTLDYAAAQEAQRELAVVAADSPRAVVLDLAALEYLDSSGITVLLSARMSIRAAGGLVLMTNASPRIRRVLEITNVFPGVPLFRSRAELDAYLAKLQESDDGSG